MIESSLGLFIFGFLVSRSVGPSDFLILSSGGVPYSVVEQRFSTGSRNIGSCPLAESFCPCPCARAHGSSLEWFVEAALLPGKFSRSFVSKLPDSFGFQIKLFNSMQGNVLVGAVPSLGSLAEPFSWSWLNRVFWIWVDIFSGSRRLVAAFEKGVMSWMVMSLNIGQFYCAMHDCLDFL